MSRSAAADKRYRLRNVDSFSNPYVHLAQCIDRSNDEFNVGIGFDVQRICRETSYSGTSALFSVALVNAALQSRVSAGWRACDNPICLGRGL